MGIDYGRGTTNIDLSNGIRFGVINQNVVHYWSESSLPNYGEPSCPKCGNEVTDYDDENEIHQNFKGYRESYRSNAKKCCEHCEVYFDESSDDLFGEDPLNWILSDSEYEAIQSSDDGDIFITKSPFYTNCNFCSPCAPGAGYLLSNGDDCKAYCFGPDMFEGEPPYQIFRVDNDKKVTK